MDPRTKIKREALNKLDEAVSFELKRLNDGMLPLGTFNLQCIDLFSEEELMEIWPTFKRLKTPGFVAFYCNIRGINSPIVDRFNNKNGKYPR